MSGVRGSEQGQLSVVNVCPVKCPLTLTLPQQDGLHSAQFEHTLLVKETGCDVLTLRPEEDGKPHFMTTVKHS